eukprot:1161424-Pelagomonas_calceolata.AAC.1
MSVTHTHMHRLNELVAGLQEMYSTAIQREAGDSHAGSSQAALLSCPHTRMRSYITVKEGSYPSLCAILFAILCHTILFAAPGHAGEPRAVGGPPRPDRAHCCQPSAAASACWLAHEEYAGHACRAAISCSPGLACIAATHGLAERAHRAPGPNVYVSVSFCSESSITSISIFLPAKAFLQPLLHLKGKHEIFGALKGGLQHPAANQLAGWGCQPEVWRS